MAETIIIIGVIVEVITLIVFFVMASNVASIKKNLCNTSAEEYMRMAGEEEFVGNKLKAKEYLMRAKYRYEVAKETYYLPNGLECDRRVIIAQIEKKISEL